MVLNKRQSFLPNCIEKISFNLIYTNNMCPFKAPKWQNEMASYSIIILKVLEKKLQIRWKKMGGLSIVFYLTFNNLVLC